MPNEEEVSPETTTAEETTSVEMTPEQYIAELKLERESRAKLEGEFNQFKEAFAAVTRAASPQPQVSDVEIDDTLMYTDPKAYREAMAKSISERVRREVQNDTMSQRDREVLLEEFPELGDKSNPFFKEVDQEYANQLRRLNLPPTTVDFNLIRMTAEGADRRRLKKQINDGAFSYGSPTDGTTSPRSGSSGSSVRLTEFQREVARGLGIDEKAYADIIKGAN